jgi:hypothetical protein
VNIPGSTGRGDLLVNLPGGGGELLVNLPERVRSPVSEPPSMGEGGDLLMNLTGGGVNCL